MNELRDTLKEKISTNIESVESQLSKVKLANKLSCLVEDLTTITLDCPKDKLGVVIGKNGAMMKHICDTCHVTIDVKHTESDKASNTGSASASVASDDNSRDNDDDGFVTTSSKRKNKKGGGNASGGGKNKEKATKDDTTSKASDDGGAVRKIEITGSASAVQQAKLEIDKIINAVEVIFDEPSRIITYLTSSKYITELTKLKEEYFDLFIDISRTGSGGGNKGAGASRQVILRGVPERVQEVKKKIQNMKLATEERVLTGREATIIVGKKGATIEKLISTHLVSIDIEKQTGNSKEQQQQETQNAVIVGPPENVKSAMMEIDELLSDNRDAIERISVTPTIRRILLSDNGKLIKELQSKVNEAVSGGSGQQNGASSDDNAKSSSSNSIVFLSFEKETAANKDHPDILVKTKNLHMTSAHEAAEKFLKEDITNVLITNLSVDPFVIPTIIGKGGETIKKLTQEGGFVEVDRVKGSVLVGGTTTEGRDAVLKEVNDIISVNQLVRVTIPPEDQPLMKNQLRELNRSKTKQELTALDVWHDIDEKSGQFMLRGTSENCEKAKEILQTFLTNNFYEDINVTEEDMEALLSGGKESMIVKLASELNVKLNADRSRHVIVVRGTKPLVKAAMERLNQFLNGGNGHSVARLTVTDQVVGVVIGKGGKTRQGLEQKHEGVSINVSKSYRISIRGPEASVAACRIEILKMIASARVNQTVSITGEQEKSLKDNDAIKRISQSLSVQITIADGTAKLRGNFHDVRDAVSMLKEKLTGVYESGIELESSQFAKVRSACRDPSHFERMEAATSAKVSLDLATGTIVISGKRNNVRKAKEQVFGFLDFLLPKEISLVKLTKPLHSSVGSATSLAEVSANAGGTTLYLDRDLSSIVIQSSDPAKVQIASKLVEDKIADGEKLAYVFEVEPTEAWLIPVIIGKNGNRISSLQKESKCQIDVSKEARTVTIIGESEADVAQVKESLFKIVDKARKECIFLSLPEDAMPSFVGKGGNHIKQFATEHKVEMQRQKKGPYQFKVTGEEEAVAAAKKAVDDWVSKWEEANGSTSFTIEKQHVVVLIGNKGETAKKVQDEFGCRIDVDKQTLVVRVRSGTEEGRTKSVEKIKEILAKADAEAAEKSTANAAAAAKAKEAAAASAATSAGASGAPKDGGKKAAARSRSNSSDDDVEINRASEFPTLPVGMAAKPNDKKKKNKNNKKKNGSAGGGGGGNDKNKENKTKEKENEVEVDETVFTGTEAGRSLFQMLISD